jgi:hypothetical protein
MNRNKNPYKKVGEVLKINFTPSSKEKFQPSRFPVQQPTVFPVQQPSHFIPTKQKSEINIDYSVSDKDLTDPEVWGPSFWFTLHNGSLSYPENASPIIAERLKGFILGLPYMLACSTCKLHAISYIEQNSSKLDDVCRGRDKLFNFFVDFHNYVNSKSGKKIFTYEEARDLYNKKASIKVMKFN